MFRSIPFVPAKAGTQEARRGRPCACPLTGDHKSLRPGARKRGPGGRPYRFPNERNMDYRRQ